MVSSAIIFLLRIVGWLILIRVILSWLRLESGGVFVQFIYQVTEPILAPVRRLLLKSSIGKNLYLDFSPIVVWLIIDFIIIPFVRAFIRF
jgi:YggT family protein